MIKCECQSFNKDYSRKVDKELNNRFKNTFNFCNNDINKFILFLVVYPSEFMNDWETFHESSLLEKEEFYSNLNMKDIKDSDCNHAKKI